MKRLFFFAAVLCAGAALARPPVATRATVPDRSSVANRGDATHDPTSADPNITVAINPASATLSAFTPLQLDARVSGGTDSSVRWTSDCGLVDFTGLYTPPWYSGTCHVTATSLQDPTKSATATVMNGGVVLAFVSATTMRTNLDKLFPNEFTGNWFFLEGNGRTAGTLALSAVGSPTTQTDRICPNGPDCANAVSQRTSASNYYATGNVASPTGDYSIGAVFRADEVATGVQTLVARWTGSNVNPPMILYLASNGSLACIVGKALSTTTIVSAAVSIAPGQIRNAVCTYDYVTDGSSIVRLYLDGVEKANSTMAVGPLYAVSLPWAVGQYSLGGSPLNGTIFAAWGTEKVLSSASVTAMAAATLPYAQGTRAEEITSACSTARACCTDAACTMLATNRTCMKPVTQSWTNIALGSNSFADFSMWGGNSTTGCTFTANADIGPDGKRTATKVISTGLSNCSKLQQLAVTSGITYTLSGFLRAGAISSLRLRGSTGSGMETGCTVTAAADWKRYSCTGTATTTGNVYFIVEEQPGVSGDAGDWYVDDLQVEVGGLHDFCPTTNTSTATCNKVITSVDVSGSWVNLMKQSSSLDQSPWTTSGSPAVIANAAVGPFGTKTAEQLTVDGPANATASVQQAVSGGTGLASYTPSFWMQRVSTLGVVSAANPGASANGQLDIDLSKLGDGWNWITPTHPAATITNAFTYTSAGIGGLVFRAKMSGALTFNVEDVQLEDGTVVHAPCATTDSTQTCVGNNTAISTTGWPTTSGSLSFTFTPMGTVTSTYLLEARTSGSNPGILLWIDGSNELQFRGYDASTFSLTTSTALSWDIGTTYYVRVEWGGGNVYLYRDDVLVGSTTSGTAVMPSGFPPTVGLGGPAAGPPYTTGLIGNFCIGSSGACQ